VGNEAQDDDEKLRADQDAGLFHNEWVVHLIIQDDRCSTRGVERNHGANRGDVAQDAADEEERYWPALLKVWQRGGDDETAHRDKAQHQLHTNDAPAQHDGTETNAELAHGNGADAGAQEVSTFVCHTRGDETNEVQT